MKLEDNFKDKLEGRRIAPTASAWDRIEGKLEAEQGKKKSKVVLWLGIAASFVAGVFLTALIFGGDGSSIESELVISTDDTENVEEVQTPFIKLEKEKTIEVVEVAEKEEKIIEDNIVESNTPLLPTSEAGLQKRTEEKENPTKNTSREVYRPEVQTTSKVETAIAASDAKQKEFIIERPLDIKSSDNKNLTGEAVAALNPTAVKDAEIDALLKNAQLEVKKNSKYTVEATIVVDANELLLDAEAEVDPDSFKDRMFRTLKKEVNRAIEAVANKDN